MTMTKRRWLRFLPAAIGTVLIALIALGIFLLRDVFQKPVQTKKQVQQISVVQPPPPPPPPPQEQKPPEPEVKEEKIEEPEPEAQPEPEPEPQAEAPPPGEDLGVDSEGGAGGDAFGLVGKKGGRSLIGGGGNGRGGSGTGGGNPIIWYGQHVGQTIQEELNRKLKDKARSTSYSAILHLWIGPDGRVTRVELANSSGNADIDEALRSAVAGIHDRLRPPPGVMPQPLKVRIRS